MGSDADAADADATWTVAEATGHGISVNVQVVKKTSFFSRMNFFFLQIFVFKLCMLESTTRMKHPRQGDVKTSDFFFFLSCGVL